MNGAGITIVTVEYGHPDGREAPPRESKQCRVPRSINGQIHRLRGYTEERAYLAGGGGVDDTRRIEATTACLSTLPEAQLPSGRLLSQNLICISPLQG